ncbi:MAG: VanZ family protein [Anaerolineales bacterium]
MAVIFYFSSQPSNELPNFGLLDYLVKKSGHMTVYAALALSLWFALEWKLDWRWLAWLIAVLYAATDEFHQVFTPGRHPSVWDVVIFDNLGALISLAVISWWRNKRAR